MTARYLVMGNGPLHRPKLPGVAGIESFRGHTFHTSRWDYDYTGGDSNGNLAGLRDKRVGIIGTGATAVQVVPHVAASAAQLFVFQRTPSSIDVRANRPTDPSWASSLEPGWQRRRMENFTVLTSGGMAGEDLVMDGWTDIIGRLLRRLREQDGPPDENLATTLELADFEKMEQIRARVDAVVTDPATATALKPWYRQFCKRPCFHDEYLQSFNRANVTLVDTEGRGVDRIGPDGVVVGGREYAVDCLIFATGFEVGTDYTQRAGYDVVGSRGRTLSEHWIDGMRSVHGMHVHGFPNMFVLGSFAGRVHGQLPAPARRGQHPPVPHSATRHRQRGDHGRGDRPGRRGVDRDLVRVGSGYQGVPGAVHAGLLQQRGSTRRRWVPGQLLREGPHALLPAPGGMAR